MQYGIKTEMTLGGQTFTARRWFDSEDQRDQAIDAVRSQADPSIGRIVKVRDAERTPGMENDVDVGALRRMGFMDGDAHVAPEVITSPSGRQVVINIG